MKMGRRRLASLFLVLLAVGVLWPAVAGAVSCGGGDCCKERSRTCGIPTTGFSLCCLHSVSTLPDLPRTGVAPVAIDRLAADDESGGPPPEPRGILHVPKALFS
ncbi:MAG TPA: hypothetical protein VHC97_23835 [Thermoanaerobaculia bacterium]|jgi:hypothetical protein|nr:hypothetical protein [Thermoanaerobaculia bacterium]